MAVAIAAHWNLHAVSVDLGWFFKSLSMAVRWISIPLGRLINRISMDFNAFPVEFGWVSNGIWKELELILHGFQCFLDGSVHLH